MNNGIDGSKTHLEWCCSEGGRWFHCLGHKRGREAGRRPFLEYGDPVFGNQSFIETFWKSINRSINLSQWWSAIRKRWLCTLLGWRLGSDRRHPWHEWSPLWRNSDWDFRGPAGLINQVWLDCKTIEKASIHSPMLGLESWTLEFRGHSPMPCWRPRCLQ